MSLFKPLHSAQSYRPIGPGDASKEEYKQQMAECEGCKHRIRGRCQLAGGQLVSLMARRKSPCPLKRKAQAKRTEKPLGPSPAGPVHPPHRYPLAPPRAIRKIAAVTCHYNPLGYDRPHSNYLRFASALPADLDLWTVELVYDGSPLVLPHGPRMLRVMGGQEHVLWQKERLLNLAIEWIPPEYDAIAWLDADLIWLNRDWHEAARTLLESYAVVQLFEQVIDTDAAGRIERRLPGHVFARQQGLRYGRPGAAWAARREAIACGLYDRHAIGGGDSAAVCAWENRELPPSLSYGTAWSAHYGKWADQAHALAGRSLASVPGEVLHLYHGTRENRRYVERYQIFHDHAYDPVGDLEIDPENGLLRWTDHAREHKPDMIRRVRDYFQDRREDE